MLKRLFDIGFSLFGLLLLFPLFIVIGVLIAIDSKGGVFYFQSRVGKDNKDFKLIKFRSMRKNSDRDSLLTVGNDDARITKIGALLRRYKLDELPQLFNVLIGNMSFVGPRPEVRKYVNLYSKEQMKVLQVKPGITDLASLTYFEENESLAKADDFEKTYIEIIMPHKLKLNAEYINKATISNDIQLIIKTINRIFK